MAKVKKAFFCRNCGFEAPKWLGRCPSCGEWNTFTEEVIARESGGGPATVANLPKARPQRIADIHESEHRRIDLGNREVNRVLGGGLVPGSLVLLGGEPVGPLDGVVRHVFAAARRRFLQHHVDRLGGADAHRGSAARRAEQAQLQLGARRQAGVGADFQQLDLRPCRRGGALRVGGAGHDQGAGADQQGGGRADGQRRGQRQGRDRTKKCVQVGSPRK